MHCLGAASRLARRLALRHVTLIVATTQAMDNPYSSPAAQCCGGFLAAAQSKTVRCSVDTQHTNFHSTHCMQDPIGPYRLCMASISQFSQCCAFADTRTVIPAAHTVFDLPTECRLMTINTPLAEAFYIKPNPCSSATPTAAALASPLTRCTQFLYHKGSMTRGDCVDIDATGCWIAVTYNPGGGLDKVQVRQPRRFRRI